MFDDASSLTEQLSAIRKESRAILIALLFPTIAILLNGSMFNVALPTIRDDLAISADVAAWLAIAFTLPFMMFMPLYGRLGDELGKPRLLLAGLAIFFAGSALAFSSDNFTLLFLGRLVQGAGSAGITPLSLAILAERFPPEERGWAMGTWNSAAPATSVFGPTLGGFLVDSLGWRAVFVPVLVVALLAVWVIRRQVPTLREKPNWAVLRTFDWGGVLLFSGAVISLVIYVSSRPVTGVEPLQDGRLLVGTVFFGVAFALWERRRSRPLIDFHIWRGRAFNLASISAGLRMAMMAGIGFLLPLYLADLYGLSASAIGLLASIHSVALFVTIHQGGPLADRWSNRWLIMISLGLQMGMMGVFALLPQGLSLYWIAAVAAGHGAGAGLSLAALHRTALGNITPEQTGAAAGMYSMTRFGGLMLGTAVAGIILQRGLDRGLPALEAYQVVYGFLAATGLVGVLLASRLRD